jgi:catalase
LDSTKLIPEELIPVKPVCRMVLNRNPENFFAETEQVAFCTAHVVPGIDSAIRYCTGAFIPISIRRSPD